MNLSIKAGMAMREIRKEKNIKSSEIGEAWGVDKSNVSRLERGVVPLRLNHVEIFCKVAKIKPSAFFRKVLK
jgi:transcriptional regulator with XRE-family HTH domain